MKHTLSIAMLLAASLLAAPCQAEEVKLQDLLHDVQQQIVDKQQYLLVWWIPIEYWEAAFRDQPGLTEIQKKEVYRTFDDYFLVCVADGSINAMGDFQGKSRAEIIKSLSIKMSDGTPLTLLSDDKISTAAKKLIEAMKPAMANTAGKVGEGMEFVFFHGKDSQGNRLADPTKDGGFTVKVGDETVRWRLPLGSLLPPRFDGETGEKFPGNYLYNPFTGKKLSAESPK